MPANFLLAYSLPYQASPTGLFSRLLTRPSPALLHSADQLAQWGRYDIFTADPVVQVHYTGGVFTYGTMRQPTEDPWEVLAHYQQQFVQQLLAQHSNRSVRPNAKSGPPPFTGGFLGYFGYGLHQQLERHLPAPPDPTGLPQLAGGFYDFAVVTDHQQHTTTLYNHSPQRQAQVLGWLRKPIPPSETLTIGPFAASTSNLQYHQQFTAIQQYLNAGDTYQVNLAVHYQAKFAGDPWRLYQHWCQHQPAPFSAYLQFANTTPCTGEPKQQAHLPPTAILSHSPERFLQVNDHTATVCPIKGTRPRGTTPAEDVRLAAQLKRSSKDQAENLMIVDLLRNDLGQVCIPGSITVPELFTQVAFSNVHHLVSTITGQLPIEVDALAAFAALFPSGSITGAPKIRAVDIINQLEPVARSIYCGSIGYWDLSGNLDSNVAIRTAVVNNSRLHLWGGGGVVAESELATEQAEIQAKIGLLMDTATTS